ncbi:MAG: YbaB/EbfC family nucleoid-associated protein [Elusimicrobia bacterium]|nr:YbaB/EbfC family nucleoid-associated protein [Elusimicrobiota bacterium]
MFDKLKQLGKLKEIQNILGEVKAEVEKEGVKIVLTGKLEVESVLINPALSKEKQEKVLKECFNEAIRKINLSIAQKMTRFKV